MRASQKILFWACERMRMTFILSPSKDLRQNPQRYVPGAQQVFVWSLEKALNSCCSSSVK